MKDSNIIDIKEIQKRVKELNKKKKAVKEKDYNQYLQRAFCVLQDKNRNEILYKLKNLEMYLSTTKVDDNKVKEMIDEILDSNKTFFIKIYNRYISWSSAKLNKDSIEEVMNYAVVSNGKRIRAFLIFLIFYFNDGIYYQNIEPFMIAIELIHAFSLIHDDLPALDNDVLRRGKPSTWKKYGEAEAILAGDALLNMAYNVLFDYYLFISNLDIRDMIGLHDEVDFQDTSLFSVKKNDIYAFSLFLDLLHRYQICLATLSAGTGIYGMIGGEYKDIKFTGKKVSQEKTIDMYIDKTAVLLAVPMQIGCIMAFVYNQNDISLYTKIGVDLGVLYQLNDDLLGMIGDEKKLGKPVGSDKKNKKNLAIKNVKELEKKIDYYENNIIKNIDKLKMIDANKKRVFKAFVTYLSNRDH